MKIVFATILIGVAIVGAFVLLNRGGENSVTENSVAEKKLTPETAVNKAPNFSLKDYNGNEVALADFAGKNIVLNSWAAWCPFCVQELKDFSALQEELGEKIVIIGIDRAESLKIAKEYSDDAGVTGRLILLLDPSDSFYRSIGGFSMPETIFVDGGGNILLHKRGPMNLEEMKEKSIRLFKL